MSPTATIYIIYVLEKQWQQIQRTYVDKYLFISLEIILIQLLFCT